jgi:hypothetical protein
MLPYPLPFCRFAFPSSLRPDDVGPRLLTRLAPAPSIGERASFGIEAFFRKLEGQGVPLWFEGHVQERSFRLHRFTSSRNSFAPILVGKVTDVHGGTLVSVFARPHWGVLAFLLLWFVAVAADAFPFSPSSLPHFELALLLAPFVMFAVTFPFQLVRVRRELEAFLNPPEAHDAA